MTRRRVLALLATLAAWPFTRLRAREIAENGSPSFAMGGERPVTVEWLTTDTVRVTLPWDWTLDELQAGLDALPEHLLVRHIDCHFADRRRYVVLAEAAWPRDYIVRANDSPWRGPTFTATPAPAPGVMVWTLAPWLTLRRDRT
jgi:hypothetical protein